MNRQFSRQQYWGRTALGVVAGRGDSIIRCIAGSDSEHDASPLASIRGEQ